MRIDLAEISGQSRRFLIDSHDPIAFSALIEKTDRIILIPIIGHSGHTNGCSSFLHTSFLQSIEHFRFLIRSERSSISDRMSRIGRYSSGCVIAAGVSWISDHFLESLDTGTYFLAFLLYTVIS